LRTHKLTPLVDKHALLQVGDFDQPETLVSAVESKS
jgi:hypothetical protein